MGLEFVYRAFWDLSSSRATGMSMGAIPWAVVDAYADAHNLNEDDSQDLLSLIRRMDSAFLGHYNDESKKGKK
jgi:hypothetical protein